MAENKRDKRGLGRGLSALMADVAPVEDPSTDVPAGGHETVVAVELITPNEDQPRRTFDDEQLNDLANSIREKGIIQPLILRPHPRKANQYQIVAGERRWRAAQIANLHELPAIVRDYSETEMLEIAIIENIQRAELNSIEEAAGYRQLMDRFGHTQEKISEALGKSRSHIANLLRLLNLPDDVQEMVKGGSLSAGHARALVTADNASELARKIVKGGLSVRATEALVKSGGGARKSAPKAARGKDADTTALENDLSAATGLKISIDHGKSGESGRVSIDYPNLDDLDRICQLLSASR
ncbi:Chromosome (plasmid) partitioning protein ParB [Candidatus Rhodobacter oscarellae]|uniref:Chromosome (Plasmid) partitioning protein ParB n=1 Tax=Candidatus Rhodobacter oscarellae TaxID=1675527 RepID=A0A0J9E834_9RHOB|nr:ParB/RepB/Spo0J family partition protein [Candidatus Rhodobacter lobularis]KMW58896.1 Chromosome (plasmid) partitioning protein ParB [Candidatus Rhodobacter lobularis]